MSAVVSDTARARGPREVALPRLSGLPSDFDGVFRRRREPAIVTGVTASWPASRWTPRGLKERFAGVRVQATIQPPETGVPYLAKDRAYRRTVAVGEFVDLMESGAACYIDQLDLAQLPGLDAECAVDTLAAPGRRILNLWIGARTRSGLHYDPMDNFLVQLYGEKSAILVSPADQRRLYPFADNIAKSRIDPEAPDLARYPRFGDAVLRVGTLRPGEALYIPRGWWHFLRAPASSISLNVWHEPSLTVTDQLRALGALGPAGWLRVGRDFAWHGLLRRDYEQRLYSPPPTGKQLYDLCAMLLTRKPLVAPSRETGGRP